VIALKCLSFLPRLTPTSPPEFNQNISSWKPNLGSLRLVGGPPMWSQAVYPYQNCALHDRIATCTYNLRTVLLVLLLHGLDLKQGLIIVCIQSYQIAR
jgi:hypothetical protein